MPHLLISAAHKSSGKTTVTLGLCAALVARGLQVQPFKKGPDYIDPLWLSQAAQRPCHNLDFQIMNEAEIVQTVVNQLVGADIGIIEGNKGLYDGMDVQGTNSNAALAKLLNAPVVLVLSTHGMTRGIVPLMLGYQAFDPQIQIAGVILNHVGGARHESKLRAAIAYYSDIPVLGALPSDQQLTIVERHLGLMPSNEHHQAAVKIQQIAAIVAQQVDLDKIIQIANLAPALPVHAIPTILPPATVKIGIIRDAAFGFYYPGDLDNLCLAGAELVFINALQDKQLPEIDGLFIGGGFPETWMQELANNHSLKHAIFTAINNNLPVYAECGGLMYLARQLTWKEQSAQMVGALPFDTVMQSRPQGRGYVRMQETGAGLWALRDQQGQLAEFAAHEFHYSKAINLPDNLSFAYKVLRGYGMNGEHDGVVYKNTLASYVHLRDVASNRWTQRFVDFVKRCKQLNS
jgi:cobyrinic acid a,c-diamide synthase